MFRGRATKQIVECVTDEWTMLGICPRIINTMACCHRRWFHISSKDAAVSQKRGRLKLRAVGTDRESTWLRT